MYIAYATSSHEKTSDIINFAQSEEGNLVENERNSEENESISPLIDESSTENDSDEVYISINMLEDIWDGSQIHQEINSRYDRLIIHERIKKTQNEWTRE